MGPESSYPQLLGDAQLGEKLSDKIGVAAGKRFQQNAEPGLRGDTGRVLVNLGKDVRQRQFTTPDLVKQLCAQSTGGPCLTEASLPLLGSQHGKHGGLLLESGLMGVW